MNNETETRMLNKDKNLKFVTENCGSETWDRDTGTEQIKTQVYLQASSGDMQLFAFVDLSEVMKTQDLCLCQKKRLTRKKSGFISCLAFHRTHFE